MKLKLEVGEPRGFDAGDKTNTIIGTVIESLSGSQTIESPTVATLIQGPGGGEKKAETVTEYWFVVNCSPVVFKDMRFSSLLLTPRYRVKRPPLESLGSGESLVINAIWRHDGGVWDKESIEAAQEGRLEVNGIIVAKATGLPEDA